MWSDDFKVRLCECVMHALDAQLNATDAAERAFVEGVVSSGRVLRRIGLFAEPGRSPEPDEADICLVILSPSLAEAYGLRDHSAHAASKADGSSDPDTAQGASALLENPPAFQMPKSYDFRAWNGSSRVSGLCVWDPITGYHICTDRT